MAIGQYWVGQKPAKPISITVRDSQGNPIDLGMYGTYKVRMVGSENEPIDMGNYVLESAGAKTGRFVFIWPTNKSLFDKPGEYLLQLDLAGEGRRDFTTTYTMRVKELGGK